ncbi:transporter substrate-binding domain-containing protein [Amaricoccus sp.]|uniref:transporter substrate-binding domain-containing protein n=1 Tax=Amaricoccus sp. TaxID=1872485 RepID=UPI002630028F|nr:transporter substrate-binding domain-containing protein [uncultured Amaricoccus sp.]
MKRSLCALAVGVCIAAATPALALNVCVEGAFPPFSETAPDGSIVGFDIDIAQAVCAEIGQSCTLLKVDWDGMIPALLEKKCDTIIASMSATPERQQVIDFTSKYYNVPNRFVGRADAGLTDTTEGLAGKVIGVQRGTTWNAFVEKNYPEAQLQLYGTQDEAFLDLSAGRVDAVMADVLTLDVGFLKTPAGAGFAMFGENHLDSDIFGDGLAFGVRKDDTALRDQLSAAILAIRADGEYDAIQKKYFDFDIYGG